MRWRAVNNNVDDTGVRVLQEGPWAENFTVPPFGTKKDFRKWCVSPDTRHCFFTPFEGINPAARVGPDNPALRLWGWVADFDTEIDINDLINRIVKKCPSDVLPVWVSSTFSKGARVVWEFENPVFADNLVVIGKFMRKLASLAKVASYAPMFDEASYEPQMTWELGRDWKEVPGGSRIGEDVLRPLLHEALIQTKLAPSTYEDIPFDEVQAEIEKQFPGRLYGAKVVKGERIPLFWLPICGDNKEQDRSAQVAEWGVWSFSSRSEKGMMFWDELLGENFVRRFKEKRISAATSGVYYDGKIYWVKSGNKWLAKNTENMTLQLKAAAGLSATKFQGEVASEVDHALFYIQTHSYIDSALPFPHTSEQFVQFNGFEFLNTSTRHPMQPAPASDKAPEERFPWLWKFLQNFLAMEDDDMIHPKNYFLAELKRAYMARLDNRSVSKHALVFCGSVGKGKSLLATVIIPRIFGSGTDAGKFLVSGKEFNKEAGESFVWYIDDNKSTESASHHKGFSEALKKHVATPVVVYRPMYRDAVTIPWYGMVIITCNDDPDSVTIIPDLDISSREKISLFMINPEWDAEFLDNDSMGHLLDRELPHFCRWLMDWEPPEGVMSERSKRYGVEVYHNSKLVRTVRDSSNLARLAEVLEMWRVERPVSALADNKWEGTAAELLRELLDSQFGTANLMRGTTPVQFGRQLQMLLKSGIFPALLGRKDRSGTGVWVLEKLRSK